MWRWQWLPLSQKRFKAKFEQLLQIQPLYLAIIQLSVHLFLIRTHYQLHSMRSSTTQPRVSSSGGQRVPGVSQRFSIILDVAVPLSRMSVSFCYSIVLTNTGLWKKASQKENSIVSFHFHSVPRIPMKGKIAESVKDYVLHFQTLRGESPADRNHQEGTGCWWTPQNHSRRTSAHSKPSTDAKALPVPTITLADGIPFCEADLDSVWGY